MVIHIELGGRELIGAGFVFAGGVAGLEVVIDILELFAADMIVLHASGKWKVRHDVLVVSDSPSGYLAGCKGRVGLVSGTRLTEVVHRARDTGLDEIHGGELSESSAETVTSDLDGVGGVQGTQALDFGENPADDLLLGLVKAFVYLAVTIREGCVGGLPSIEIGDPIANILRSSVSDIDGLVGWEIANIALSVGVGVRDYIGHDEACGWALESVSLVVALATISSSR